MGKAITGIEGQTFNFLTVIRKTDKKSGSSYLWECKCECGNITLSTYSSLKTGKKKSCGCLQRKKASELGKTKGKNLLNMMFGDLEVFAESDERIDGRKVWICRCNNCGREDIKVTSHDLLGKRKTHCGCKLIASAGEESIIKILTDAGITFEREKTYPDLRGNNNKPLRYDFYLPDYNLLIEYDGKQHFLYDEYGYGQDLVNIQYRDNIKNQYCFDNNINLIRIPYTYLKDLTLNDLLLDSKFLLNGSN